MSYDSDQEKNLQHIGTKKTALQADWMRGAAKDRPPRAPQRLCQLPTDRQKHPDFVLIYGRRSVDSLRQLARKSQSPVQQRL